MKYGLNLLLWTDRMHEGMTPVVERIKALGYDGVEMPIFELNESLYQQWGKTLDGIGLERTAVTVRGAGDNPISPSASVRPTRPLASLRVRAQLTTNLSGALRPCKKWPTMRPRPE